MSTSFYQYQYCSLCKKNHKQRKKKHIYSKSHQDVLNSVISKFRLKIADAKTLLLNPAVRESGWEVDSRVWCYFCEAEVKKHKSEDECVLVFGSFLQHLASADHSKKTGAFFWQNIIPMDQKPEFLIGSEDYNRFILLANQAILSFRENLEQQIKKEAGKIAEADARSQTLRWMGMKEQLLKQSLGQVNVLRQHPAKQSEQTTRGKKTVAAFSQGLTCIVQQEGDDGRADFLGNVFTDATPPWLMEDDEKGVGEIGPTAEDYKKHLERQKKQKLPACRVGVKFDRTVDTSSEWLPSFGRVWNQGRRLNSRHQYLHEKRQMKTATITSKKVRSWSSFVNEVGAGGPTRDSEQTQGHKSDPVGTHRDQARDPTVQLFTNHHDKNMSGDLCNSSLTPDASLGGAWAHGSVNSDTLSQGVTLTETFDSPSALPDNFPLHSDCVNFSASFPVYVMPYKRRQKPSISEITPKFMGLIPIASSLLQNPQKKTNLKKT